MVRKVVNFISVTGIFGLVCLAAVYLIFYVQDGKRSQLIYPFENYTRTALIIAHRGGAGLAPENTIAAFESSNKLGVDLLELDIRLSKDGQIVVMHDATLLRTTNINQNMAGLEYEEIARADAGYNWTSDKGKTHPFRGKGIEISTLRAVFEQFPDIGINIEAKVDSEELSSKLCKIIREFKRVRSVVVASESTSFLVGFRNNCGDVTTAAGLSEVLRFYAMYLFGLSENFQAEMQVLQIPSNIAGLEFLSKDLIDAARERNMKVQIWTRNPGDRVRQYVEMGVHGIINDYPDKIIGQSGILK